MDNGKHFSPSNGQQPMPPKPVVPASRRSTSRRTHTKTTGFTSRVASTAGSSGTPGGPRRPRWFKSWRSAAAAALSAVLVVAGIAGVIAWTTAQDALKNSFEIGTVVPVIDETFDPKPEESTGNVVKENVKAKNSGSVDIYVRARVNIYWVDDAGNQLWEQPKKSVNYTVESLPADNKWVAKDGYYYWIDRLAPKGETGSETGNLITNIQQSDAQLTADNNAGRKLVVDIDIQGIQADPASAVQEAWGVTVNSADGTLSIQ